MKQGWKTCKFADVFDLQMGKTPSRDNPTYWGDDNMWVSIADMNEQKYMSATKEGITDVAVQESGIKPIPQGTVIMSFKLSIGKVSIATSKLYTNEAIMGFIEKEKGTLVPEYLYYYLKGYKWEGANKAAMGMTLNKKTIAENTISYPPIEEQAKIVEELDCLSGIIEKKKQQLKELDALAQSIFYEMFGDPVENDKGWDMKKLGDITNDIFAGGDKPDDISPIKDEDYRYPIYANGDGERGLLGYSKTYRVKSKALTVGARGASIGNCRICDGEFTPVVRLITIVPSDKVDVVFLFHYVRQIEFNINGAGQAQLTTPNVKNKEVFVPPITLQQDFASKIESIEKQKELIAQSIKETETLFNSRMDYYFN